MRGFQTDETSSRIAVGLFESPKSPLTRAGRHFFDSRDVIATAPIALPERFRISVELKLSDSKSKIKTIAANSPINLTTNGFRFGFDYVAKDNRNILRINFGDGTDSKKIAFREGTVSVEDWHLVEVDVDLIEGAVQLRIDDQESDWKALKLTHFKRTGSLFFGSQEPGRGTSPMDGMMRSIKIVPLQ